MNLCWLWLFRQHGFRLVQQGLTKEPQAQRCQGGGDHAFAFAGDSQPIICRIIKLALGFVADRSADPAMLGDLAFKPRKAPVEQAAGGLPG